MLANILPAAPPPPPPPPPFRRSKFIFFGTWSYCISKGTANADILNLTFNRRSVPDPKVDLGEGVKGQNSTFSKHGHVAY